jgi:GDP-4-dehydro-6-deoxy-D-mannose reductase
MAAVLVTGAAGFAGSHLIDLLRQQQHEVVAWQRPSSAANGNHTPNVRWQAVDMLDRAAVARAIADVKPDEVYHCAGAAHIAQSWSGAADTLSANVMGTHHLFDALRNAGIKARVLIPGSSYVYRQADHPLSETDPIGPASPYALSKLAQEMLGKRANEDDGQTVFLTRSFNHTGPRQDATYAAPGFARQIAMIEAGRMPPTIEVGNLDASRDICDVRDTARAYLAIVAKGRPGVIYNVCSGRAVKIRSILDRLVAMSRVDVRIHVDPNRYRPNDNPMLVGNPARIQSDTGWSPTVPLDETLADLLSYWRKAVE